MIKPQKGPSERQLIARHLADFICANRLANPFGGDVNLMSPLNGRGKYYGVDFSVPAVLDDLRRDVVHRELDVLGAIQVWSPTFIAVQCRGKLCPGGSYEAVYESPERVESFLKAAFVDHDWDAVGTIPTKAPKEAK